MPVSVRQQIAARIDPTFRVAPRPAGAPSLAGPIDLLGAPPDRTVTYLTETARALLSPDAANVDVPYDPPPSPGSRFQAEA